VSKGEYPSENNSLVNRHWLSLRCACIRLLEASIMAKEQYKINLHAHTFFSDGANSPYTMALEAKRLGLCCLILTDHFYPKNSSTCFSMGPDRYRLRNRASFEAREILPIINGLELAFGNEEMLVFGGEMIQKIYQHCSVNKAELTISHLEKWKRRYESAFILCHPHSPSNWDVLRGILDGYERYNSGWDMFPSGADFSFLKSLPSWCNSDAHECETLCRAYNLIDTEIKTEYDLIQYLKSGKQPVYYINQKEEVTNNGY